MSAMYAEWASLTEAVRSAPCSEPVLSVFSPEAGREVVRAVLTSLATAEPPTDDADSQSTLSTPEQIRWTMQVLGYGLTLPLAQKALIELCIDMYDGWLSSLHAPKKTTPQPINKDPAFYSQIIFEQFCELFVPRPLRDLAESDEHYRLCEKVLSITFALVRKPNVSITRDTWNSILKYLLKVADTLLSPPSAPNSLGAQLCPLLIHVLFLAWLRSCVRCFPTPSLWKSLRELCCTWRHHHSVVKQWSKLTYSLTLKVIAQLYTPKHLGGIHTLPEEDPDFKDVSRELDRCTLLQTWFRLLHTLGNPVELSYPSKISSTPAFQNATASDSPHTQHTIQSCLQELPRTFLEAMKGVATLVFLYLAQEPPRTQVVAPPVYENLLPLSPGLRQSPQPARRKDSREWAKNTAGQFAGGGHPSSSKLKTKWYIPFTPSVPGLQTSPVLESRSPSSHLHPSTHAAITVEGEVKKPKGNTLLHLFGSWLFEAAIWPVEEAESKRRSRSSMLTSFSDLSHLPDTLSHQSHDPAGWAAAAEYEEGRAEAYAALCCVFSSQPCGGEPFLPVYLARFYHALVIGLQYIKEFHKGEVLTKVILNSADLLRKDLQGINVVVPHFLSALELILPLITSPFKCKVNFTQLRQASIRLLLSMLSLPLHFLYLPLPDLSAIVPDLQAPSNPSESSSTLEAPPPAPSGHTPQLSVSGLAVGAPPPLTTSTSLPSSQSTFVSLKDRLLQLLFAAIGAESDTANMQMLLHGLMVITQDIVTYENAVAKMVEEEVPEDSEVSAILRDHPPLASTRSDASVYSQSGTQAAAGDSFAPPQLFSRACQAMDRCLWPGENSSSSGVQVPLAALELLSGLAALQIENIDHADCRYAVKMVCTYIEYQASKEHTLHNRDLHTSIVAAFKTLIVWVIAHPYLLGDDACVISILKVIELGISGSFSVESDGRTIYKGDKVAKPVSGRVKEVAEFALACVMERVGSFPLPCGAESASSLLTEEDLLNRLPSAARKEDARFRYFVMDNSVVLALLEEPFSQNRDALPTVSAIVRSPTGRHVWTMQLRHFPRSVQPPDQHLSSMSRPIPNLHTPVPPDVERKPWPDEVNKEPSIRVDRSIPALEDVLDNSTAALHSTVDSLAVKQSQAEEEVHGELRDRLAKLAYPDSRTALEPPQVKHSFETARLLLTHLGLLGIESVKDNQAARYPVLAMLDSTLANFQSSLRKLDGLPGRYCNTVFVLHCREGACKPVEILTHQQSLANKPAEFIEFLHGLGWIVDPVTHPGFSGKIRESKLEDSSRPVGMTAQIPLRPFPYHADAIHEMAFVVPTLKPSASDSATSVRSVESSDSGQDGQIATGNSTPVLPHHTTQPPPAAESQTPTLPSSPFTQNQPSTLFQSSSSLQPLLLRDPQGSGVSESSVQAEVASSSSSSITATADKGGLPASTSATRVKQHGGSRTEGGLLDTPRRRTAVPQDCAAMVVWLENFDDHSTFPLEALSAMLHGSSSFSSGLGSHKATTNRVLPTIFIHMLASGLYQITTKSSSSRLDSMAGPLIDGMVVSRRTLSALVRQTTGNMCSRHRVENEGYSPPTVSRKRKIEELANRFSLHIPVAEFYTRLFTEGKRTEQK